MVRQLQYPKPRGLKGGVIGAVLGLALLAPGWGEDFEMVFSREVRAQGLPEDIAEKIRRVPLWPAWHFSAREAVAIDGLGRPLPLSDQICMTGRRVRLKIVPKGHEYRHFFVEVSVKQFSTESRTVELELVRDSRERMGQVVSAFRWAIGWGGTDRMLRVDATGRTHGFRSRWLARVAPRILMNQLLLADVQTLAEFTPAGGLQSPLTPPARQ